MPLRASTAFFPIAILLLMAALGLGVSPDRSASQPAFWQLVVGVALFFAIAAAIRSDRDARLAAYLLAAGGAATALLALLGTDWTVVRLASLPEFYERIPALLRDVTDQRAFHPRVMGMALAVMLPVCLSLALFARSRGLRLTAAGAALLAAAVLPLTQAVQGFLGLAFGLWLLAVWRTRWALLALPLALFAGYALARAGDLHGLLLRAVALDDVGGIGVALRLDIWSRAWDMLRDMPLTGPGLHTFPVMVWNFYPGYLIGPELHAHNVFLQVALDLGVPGLVAFLTILVAAGITAVRCQQRTDDRDLQALVVGAAGGIAAYLGAGLMDSPWSSKPGILLWILLGVLAGVAKVVDAAAPAPVALPRGRRAAAAALWALPALLTAAVLLLVPGVFTRNTGLLGAQRLLLAARAGEPVAAAAWEQPAAALQAALQQPPIGGGDPHPAARLASVYTWQGDYAAALAELGEQVEQDNFSPIARYAPFEAFRRLLAGEAGGGSWADLLAVYGQWMARFPQRAENYAAAAVIYAGHLDDNAGARAVLQNGIRQGAQPLGLLEYYLARLPEGN